MTSIGNEKSLLVMVAMLGLTLGCQNRAEPVAAGGRGGTGGTGGTGGAAPDAAAAPDTRPVLRPDARPNPLDLPPPAATIPTPVPWKSVDIGAVGVKGETAVNTAGVQIRAGGDDIFGKADAFHFAYQIVKGDAEIVAKIKNIDYTHPDAKAGLMFRAGLDANAANVFLTVLGTGSGQIQYRQVVGGETQFNTTTALNIKAGVWLKITRTGNKFAMAWSPNRGAWTALGTVEALLQEDALVGLAATSHDSKVLGLAEFDAARVSNLPGTPAMKEWLAEDLGIVMGRAWVTKDGLTINSMGDANTPSREYCHLVYREMVGNFTLTARVTSVDETNPEAWAGLMARKTAITSWSRSSANVLVKALPTMGVRVQHRAADNGQSMPATLNPTAPAVSKPPVWLRLQRAAEKFTSYQSQDGREWIELATVTVGGFPENLVVGVGASSATNKAIGAATFDNISLVSAGPPPLPDAGPSEDDGGPAEDGSAPDGPPVDARPLDGRPPDGRRDR